MKISSLELLGDLTSRTRQHIAIAEELNKRSYTDLIQRPTPGSWNALECLEHLNLYGEFYLPEIEKQIRKSDYPPQALFKSRFLGNYFAESMLPKEKLNRMKTFADKDPIGADLDSEVISEFIKQQHQMLELLRAAEKVDLVKTKVPTSISKFIRLKLGDAFRVVIYHNQRHLQQAQLALKVPQTEAGSTV
ncbi:DinB superfamily protein [Salinimicrobium catena]|uniref:DinB superfamily protein n=1 Tax=Salinimicrobium catena TaxID=390640 RepID=A0A1H5H150_9FLAO|nr:DinB family protein [Salinimicrobium catena]SDK67075.1 DinB superfamily protein [Salinimicrobium catena]SEE21682.1 DinB superfamily protein [Salinimicrobium catena]